MSTLESLIGASTSKNFLFNVYTGTAALLLIGLHLFYKHKFSYWQKRGVKGPKPVPFFGNTLDWVLGDRLKLEREWVQKYGKVYGIYQGITPKLVVADPEVLTQVCIKDFEYFVNHDNDRFFFTDLVKNFIFNQLDTQWRGNRAMMAPTFTSGKIKRMFKLLDGCADDLVKAARQRIKSTYDAVLNARDLFYLYTMDGVTTCCFGLKLERADSENLKSNVTRDEFVEFGLKMFEFPTLRAIIYFAFPKLFLRMIKFQEVPANHVDPLAKRLKKLVETRMKQTNKPDDYLQILMDARADDTLELDDLDDQENHHVGVTSSAALAKEQREMLKSLDKNKTKLTVDEIVSMGTFLMAVGLETSGSLLTSCTYLLSFHPEVQEKLYEELIKIKKDGKFDYQDLTSCHYLDCVMSETLRILPPVIMMERHAGKPYHLEKYNVPIEKNVKLNLSYYAIMNDPELWEEPHKFDPERFMPNNKHKIVPGSYCPFGIGPRHCLGMRFSLTEAKLGISKLVTSFKIEPEKGATFDTKCDTPFSLLQIKMRKYRFIPRN